ncbi:hypothetical protein ILUMI_18087 [Ignelater luminosus]|uniref:Uncharacterized protein n=1 Tax=Ignelater luminosus TaxID=2038154 RepID=A0A8K0CN99_IGNLU|nr:hypothetical protein ILUMI_18087 [Ignelater luminosus]
MPCVLSPLLLDQNNATALECSNNTTDGNIEIQLVLDNITEECSEISEIVRINTENSIIATKDTKQSSTKKWERNNNKGMSFHYNTSIDVNFDLFVLLEENEEPVEIDEDEVNNSEGEEYELDKNESEKSENAICSTRKRSKKNQENAWNRNITKKRRMEDDEYAGYQRFKTREVKVGIARPQRQISQACAELCKKSQKRNCNEFPEDKRLSIFNKFWKNMDWKEKKIYVTSNIEYVATARNTAGKTSRRKGTYLYYLRKKNNRKLRVCKNMFLGTLGLKEDMVHDWAKSMKHGLNISAIP